MSCALKSSKTDIAVKLLIGTLGLAVGVTVTAMTGGTVLPVVGTVIGGTLVGGAFSGVAYAVSNVKNGEWNTEDYFAAVTYGLADGYMWSGVTAVAEAVYGWYKTGGSTAKYVGEEYYTGSSTSVEQKNTYDSAWDTSWNLEGGTPSTKPNQVHHFATNKSKKYTSQFESITKKYGLDLDADWNKKLMPHQGRHPYAYHDYVLDNMQKFDRIANGDKTKFLKLYDQMKQKVINNPEMLYKVYWKK